MDWLIVLTVVAIIVLSGIATAVRDIRREATRAADLVNEIRISVDRLDDTAEALQSNLTDIRRALAPKARPWERT